MNMYDMDIARCINEHKSSRRCKIIKNEWPNRPVQSVGENVFQMDVIGLKFILREKKDNEFIDPRKLLQKANLKQTG